MYFPTYKTVHETTVNTETRLSNKFENSKIIFTRHYYNRFFVKKILLAAKSIIDVKSCS